jgi:glycosyltransferase involved in cell wall biosynthesis
MHVWMPLIRTGSGSDVYTKALAARLCERGHLVTINEVAHPFQYAPWLAPIRPPPDANVILANSWNAAAFTGHGIPLASVCHLVVHDQRLDQFKSSSQSLFHRAFVKPMERAAVAQADLNIAVSHIVARQMQEILAANEVVVVQNGVDTDFFYPGESRQAKKVPEAAMQLVFVGKPSLRKGFDVVAKVIERFGNQARFTCVGAMPGKGLPTPAGKYTGFVDKAAVRAAYQAADLLLFPSRLEGFGLVAAEAMACGVPVATCPNSAVDEFIPEGCGIVREPDDIDGFVDDIRELMKDVSRRAALRTKLRAHAVENLSDRRWAALMENALLSLV